MMRFVNRQTRAGFTLVEVMVVVVILGILAGLIVPRVLGRTDEARVAAAKHDIAALMQSLKLYHLDNVPKDPWGNSYQYLNPGVHGEVDVFSLGADGQPGGSGADAEIGSWQL